jgi:aerobic C4-dicarboxylate transport protein
VISDPDSTARSEPPPRTRNTLYLQVLAAIVLGALLGWVRPAWGESMRPLGDVFIRMVKMLIGPIVFCTVATGIASAGDLKRVGRVGLKALIYFEVMTTIALVIGLVVVHLVEPGVGIHARADDLDAGAVASATHGREAQGIADHLIGIVPENVLGAFVSGEILQVLFLGVLAGLALASMGRRGRPALAFLEQASKVLFKVIGLVMVLAPIGAFGAMAYTIGHFGLGSLASLLRLMLAFYATALLFVFVGLGLVCRLAGVSILALLRYLREELLIVLGTSSSETVLPRLMDKLEALGCAPSIVRIVVPTGYSFNLDGTSIYLTMASVFVAQALDVELTLGDELLLLGVLLLTSKGAAAVTGGGFVTLAATLQTTHVIPVAGLSLLLGIDRFMSEARALTNLIGNSVAAIVIARWEGLFDRARADAVLGRRSPPPSEPPALDAPAP